MAIINLKKIDKKLIRAKKGTGAPPILAMCHNLKPDEAIPAQDIADRLAISIDTVKKTIRVNKCRVYLPSPDNGNEFEAYGVHPDTAKKYLE